VPLILMTHDAPFAAMKKALAKNRPAAGGQGRPIMLRVETF
jgi:hypothetical protein